MTKLKFNRLNGFNSNNVVSNQKIETTLECKNKPLAVISEGLQDNKPRNAEYWKKYCGIIDKTYVASLSDYDKEKIKKEEERLIAGGFEEEYATLLSTAGYDTDKHKFNKDYKALIHLYLPEKKGLITYHSKTNCTNLNEFAELKFYIQEALLTITNALRDNNNNFSKENADFIKEYINLEFDQYGCVDYIDRLAEIIQKTKDENGIIENKFFKFKKSEDILDTTEDILTLYSFPKEKREEIFNTTERFKKQYGDSIIYRDFYKSAFNKEGEYLKNREPIIKEFLSKNYLITPEDVEAAGKYPAIKDFFLENKQLNFQSIVNELSPLLDEEGNLPPHIKEKATKFVSTSLEIVAPLAFILLNTTRFER